jgi:signal transduction histidine kinase
MSPAFELSHLSRYFSELSSQPMLAVEGSTHIVRNVNAAFLRLALADRDELLGRPFVLAVPQKLGNRCMALFDRVYHTGRSEGLAEQKHGETPPVYWSYAAWAILGSDERPAGVMIQVSDSTETALLRARATAMNESLLLAAGRQRELKETAEFLRARLEAALKEREHWLAVLSHELRTPLTPIALAASMLHQDQRLDAETQAIMRMIHRNIMLATRLIDDSLEVAQGGPGRLDLDCCAIPLRDVLQRALEVCKTDLTVGDLALDPGVADRSPIAGVWPTPPQKGPTT